MPRNRLVARRDLREPRAHRLDKFHSTAAFTEEVDAAPSSGFAAATNYTGGYESWEFPVIGPGLYPDSWLAIPEPSSLLAHQDRLNNVRRKNREPQQPDSKVDIQPYLPGQIGDGLELDFVEQPPSSVALRHMAERLLKKPRFPEQANELRLVIGWSGHRFAGTRISHPTTKEPVEIVRVSLLRPV